jgi:hypothetical protein
MSATWTFAQLVDLLKTQLEADAGILAFGPVPDIRVSVPHAAEDISDIIALGIDAGDDDKIQTALGSHSHDEEVTVGCLAAVIRYGSGDAEAQTARDRVLAFLDVVDEHLRITPIILGAATLRAPRVENRTFESFPSQVGEAAPVRVARITFDITYKARTAP